MYAGVGRAPPAPLDELLAAVLLALELLAAVLSALELLELELAEVASLDDALASELDCAVLELALAPPLPDGSPGLPPPHLTSPPTPASAKPSHADEAVQRDRPGRVFSTVEGYHRRLRGGARRNSRA